MEINRYVVAAALVLALAGASCKGERNRVSVQNEEQGTPRLVSLVRMNDAQASPQLLNGFYGVENNAWRWTAGRFTAVLRVPSGAAVAGATLSVNFVIPELVIQKLGSVTLRASIGGTALKPESYTAPGSYEYMADVPASMLTAESVKVDFALDKSIPPGVDKRELGIIAMSVGLASK